MRKLKNVAIHTASNKHTANPNPNLDVLSLDDFPPAGASEVSTPLFGKTSISDRVKILCRMRNTECGIRPRILCGLLQVQNVRLSVGSRNYCKCSHMLIQ